VNTCFIILPTFADQVFRFCMPIIIHTLDLKQAYGVRVMVLVVEHADMWNPSSYDPAPVESK